MARFNLRCFSNPDSLKTIQEEHLFALLSPHAAYFEKRGVKLSGSQGGNSLDYEKLAAVFLSPDDETPLVDALYLIDEMSTQEGMDALLEAIEKTPSKERISLDGSSDHTPADVAVQVWLKAPNLLERKHAEQFVGERKSFEYYLSREMPRGEFSLPDRNKTEALEKDLGQWFSSKKKGDQARVFIYPKPDGIWFLVRHGEAFRREGAIKGGISTSVFFRPEIHDVLVYNPAIGELKINASSKKEKELYRCAFGQHFFSGESHFPGGTEKYTLEPLRTNGADSLVCTDIDGIDSIQLTEITYYWGGAENEVEIRRAGDLFAALKARNGKILNARLVGAKFRVKFSDCKTPRSISIRPPNVAKFTRDDDGRLVEEWLAKRGFTAMKRQGIHAKDRAAVAHT